MTFEKLVMDAIGINGGVDVWNGFGTDVRHIDISDIVRRNNKRYAVNNSVIAFCYRQVMYVIPFMRGVTDLLQKKGFSRSDFFVPFSCGEVPRYKMGQWNELLKAAKRENSRC